MEAGFQESAVVAAANVINDHTEHDFLASMDRVCLTLSDHDNNYL